MGAFKNMQIRIEEGDSLADAYAAEMEARGRGVDPATLREFEITDSLGDQAGCQAPSGLIWLCGVRRVFASYYCEDHQGREDPR